MMKIPITKPFFNEEEYALISKPLESGWVVQGPYVKQFEESIARYTGAAYAVAVSSCTSGQFIMSRILDLKPGDEVIVPSFTWISTANSIEFLGARPVFCDIDITTFNIDARQIEEKLTARTRAVYPVHLFGLAADMPEIMRIAARHGLDVVEDCACSLGARIGNTHTGLFGAGGILSFHPRKSITTGEGGMVLTNDERVASLASSLRDHGAVKTDYDRHNAKGGFLLTEYPRLGYNMRMTDIQGALGVAQSRKIEWIMSRKQELATEYGARLQNMPWLAAPVVPADYYHGYQTYCTLFKPQEAWAAIEKRDIHRIDAIHEQRNAVMADLESKGISTRQGTHAVHIQQYYRDKYEIEPEEFISSYAADRLTLALPFFPSITDEEKDYLFQTLQSVQIQ